MSLMGVLGKVSAVIFHRELSRAIESGGYCYDRRFLVFIDCCSGWLTIVHSGTVLCFVLYPPYLAMFCFMLIPT